MPRKIVFKGWLLTDDVPERDKVGLAEAFATLHRLADKGVIQFQRNAGKTVGPGRKADNVLTPQAIAILRHADGVSDFHVADVTATLDINRNSVTANLFRLSEAGYLARRKVGGGVSEHYSAKRTVWAYAITDLGRDALRHVLDVGRDAGEPESPRPL